MNQIKTLWTLLIAMTILTSFSAEAARIRRETTTTIVPKITILSSSLSKSSIMAGETLTSRVQIASATSLANLVVDIRIYNSANQMIVRKPFEQVNIAAGESISLQYDYGVPANLQLGNYNIQVGVWNTAWYTYAYETRETFSVVAPVSLSPKVSVTNSSVSASQVVVGGSLTSSVTLHSATRLSNLIVDIRIYNSANQMIVRKNFESVILPAGSSSTFSYTHITAGLPLGQYSIQVGVWDASWFTYVYETRHLFSIVSGTIVEPTPVPAPVPEPAPSTGPIVYQSYTTLTQGNFTISGTVAKTVMDAGQVQHAKIAIRSAAHLSDLIVALIYLDAQNQQLLTRAIDAVSFYAGETKEYQLDFAIRADAPAGTYSIGIGVWSAGYAFNYVYQRNIPNYRVNAIAQPAPVIYGNLPTNSFNMLSGIDAFVYGGSYFVQNNMWGITGLPAGYWQQSGIGPVTANNSVSARWIWNFPDDGPNEVKGYPAIGFGQKPGQGSTPGSNLPMHVDSITSALTSWDTQASYTGRGQLAFDLWLTRDGNRYPCFPCTPITHEIMVQVDSFGGYATSNPSWYFGSTVIDGTTYRVWKADNFGGGGVQWRFIVLHMVNPVKMVKGSLNLKGIFTYLKSVNLISGSEYLASIEFGNEMVQGTGDVLIKDFKAEVK